MIRPHVHSALPLISASQISTFRECQRKWAWRYIAKIVTPPHPSAALGTEVHDTQLGPYLTEGRPFDYTRDSGYIAAALLEYLPQPKTPGMVVEKHFILPSPASGGRFAYQGYMDLWLKNGLGLVCTDHDDCKDNPDLGRACAFRPAVVDFKTTSDLKWAKNEKALSTDVQAMLYATASIFESGVPEVDLAWLYTQTKGAKRAKRTLLRVVDDHVVEQFKAIEETALELFETKQTVTDPLSLPPSPSQCEAYGGCPYRDKCNLSPTDHIKALSAREFSLLELQGEMPMSDGTSSLLANLKARKAGAQANVAQREGAGPTAGDAGLIPAVGSSASEDAAPSPPPSSEPLGINPPEQALPPPERKRGPGRPRKNPLPVEKSPDQMAPRITDAEVVQIVDAVEEPEPKQLELPFSAERAMAAEINYDKLAILIVDQLITRIARSRGVE